MTKKGELKVKKKKGDEESRYQLSAGQAPT